MPLLENGHLSEKTWLQMIISLLKKNTDMKIPLVHTRVGGKARRTHQELCNFFVEELCNVFVEV